MVKHTESTIYRMAIENYADLGYGFLDHALLVTAMEQVSDAATRMARERMGKNSRRVTVTDAANILHALGKFMVWNDLETM